MKSKRFFLLVISFLILFSLFYSSANSIISVSDSAINKRDDLEQKHLDTPQLSENIVWKDSGTVICNATEDQWDPQICYDGAGGAIITWMDGRNPIGYYIYAQKIDSAGNTLWGANGTIICNARSSQFIPQICCDGAGGAIITWIDFRTGPFPYIYAQKVNSMGTPQWGANGTAIYNATEVLTIIYKDSLRICCDGAGGAIITWMDYRADETFDIYAQKIDSMGTPQWGANGTVICNAIKDQGSPKICCDGAGGAIITWMDNKTDGNLDIYAQKIDSAGTTLWGANGTVICNATKNQLLPQICCDGAGGAIITWMDNGTLDIYAQKINSTGTTLWGANGTVICNATKDQLLPQICCDGAGGAIITWGDYRTGHNLDIYAQKINSAGTTLWGANGTVICNATKDQWFPQICCDGSGGAIITWMDNRPDDMNFDIYAQKIDSAGTTLWGANGTVICNATKDQFAPQICCDGAGGAIITWMDDRTGHNLDIYAQKIDSLLPSSFDLTDADDPDGDGRFYLSWDQSNRADNYSIFVYDKYITEINESIEERVSGITELTHEIEEFINSTYYYVVVAYNKFGYTISNCINVTVKLTSIPESMVLTSDADDPDRDGAYLLKWTGVYGTKNFSVYVCIKSISVFNDTVELVADGLKFSSYAIQETENDDYFYIVVAFLMGGLNDTSNCINVTVELFINGYYLVAPFILDDTGGGDFMWSQLVGKPWFSGSGTYDIPYKIQKIKIDGGGAGSCLEICHSKQYFTINNSIFTNSGSGFFDAGISLDNTTNGKFLENNCSFNYGHGIYIDPSYDNIISYNIANFNEGYGIFLEDSYNNTVSNNFANYNGNYGIYLENCTENEVIGNIINDNSLSGIFLNNSHVNEVSQNIINDNPTGIFLNNSNYNVVLDNIITGHDEGKAIMEFNCTGNIFALPLIGATSGDDKEKSETLDIMIFIIIIGILGAISGAGFFLVKRSRVKLRDKEIEIETLKNQREEITEDDIAISKEKRFCIVHRGPIEGYNFICPECGTFYCVKCLEAIKEIENVCWSCGKPLDPTMPVKEPLEDEGPKPVIDEESGEIDAPRKK